MFVSGSKTYWDIGFNGSTDYVPVWGHKSRKRKKELAIHVYEGALSLYSAYGQGLVFARVKF